MHAKASDISRGRQILSRFLALAEERLAHLTDLYETGRWKLYFTQAELLDNVREAKQAVDAWTMLVSAEALPNNRPIDLNWLNHGRPLLPRRHLLPEVETRGLSSRFTQPSPEPAVETAVFNPLTDVAQPILIDLPAMAAPAQMASVQQPTEAVPQSSPESPQPAPWQNALDFALMRERYPLLRSAV